MIPLFIAAMIFSSSSSLRPKIPCYCSTMATCLYFYPYSQGLYQAYAENLPFSTKMLCFLTLSDDSAAHCPARKKTFSSFLFFLFFFFFFFFFKHRYQPDQQASPGGQARLDIESSACSILKSLDTHLCKRALLSMFYLGLQGSRKKSTARGMMNIHEIIVPLTSVSDMFGQSWREI